MGDRRGGRIGGGVRHPPLRRRVRARGPRPREVDPGHGGEEGHGRARLRWGLGLREAAS